METQVIDQGRKSGFQVCLENLWCLRGEVKLKQRGEAALGECQQCLVEEIRKVYSRQLSRMEPAPCESHSVVTTQRRERHAPAERKHALSREA